MNSVRIALPLIPIINGMMKSAAGVPVDTGFPFSTTVVAAMHAGHRQPHDRHRGRRRQCRHMLHDPQRRRRRHHPITTDQRDNAKVVLDRSAQPQRRHAGVMHDSPCSGSDLDATMADRGAYGRHHLSDRG
jgi:hypothetical protein